MMQCFNGLLQSNGHQQTDADCRYVEKECLPRLNGFVRGVNIKHGAVNSGGEFSTALWIPQPEDSRRVLQVFRVRRFGHSSRSDGSVAERRSFVASFSSVIQIYLVARATTAADQ
jgi:hypothetical protein